jgi:hypothetical protein
MLATVCTASSTDLSALLLSAPAHVNLTWAGALLFGGCGAHVRSGALAAEALAVSGCGAHRQPVARDHTNCDAFRPSPLRSNTPWGIFDST